MFKFLSSIRYNEMMLREANYKQNRERYEKAMDAKLDADVEISRLRFELSRLRQERDAFDKAHLLSNNLQDRKITEGARHRRELEDEVGRYRHAQAGDHKLIEGLKADLERVRKKYYSLYKRRVTKGKKKTKKKLTKSVR